MQDQQLHADIEALVREREHSATPHLVNERISRIEREAQAEILHSYPLYISINHITACNARCRFCFYYPQIASFPRLTTQDFAQMRWLKNISMVDLYGGLGEPLLNPDLCDIVTLLRKQNPGQYLIFTTNGQLLHKEYAERLAGVVDKITISINAARQGSYEFLMPHCNWQTLQTNLEDFQRINLTKPKPTQLAFSYVLSRHNIAELIELLPLMQRLHISELGINHFSTNGIWPDRSCAAEGHAPGTGDERLRKTDTLYFHKKLYDSSFMQTWHAFREANIQLSMPPRFEEASRIAFGGRVRAKVDVPWRCTAPWTQCYVCPPEPTAYLSRTMRQERWCVPCCSLGADISLLTPLDNTAFLENVWNSPVYQLVRKRCNSADGMLEACRLCRDIDKSDPENNTKMLQILKSGSKDIYNALELDWPDIMEQRVRAIHDEESRHREYNHVL